jgi:hypothetical protein
MGRAATTAIHSTILLLLVNLDNTTSLIHLFVRTMDGCMLQTTHHFFGALLDGRRVAKTEYVSLLTPFSDPYFRGTQESWD